MATVTFADAAPDSPGAVAYACSRLGLRVFPLVPGTKRPAIKGWKATATTDPDVIRMWWTGDFAGHGVGIATGEASNLWVLDLDVTKGQNGFKALQQLCEEHGADASDFTKTMTVATASGGAHIYFRWSAGVRNSAGGLGEGIDVRGAGGLVRAPGVDGLQVVPRNGVRSVKILAAPQWLVELCQKQTREPFDGTMGETATVESVRVMGTERTLDALGSAPAGTRNNELNRAAFRLSLRGEMTKDDAWKECRLIMVSIGANDSVQSQRNTFESGWEGGLAKRGSIHAHQPGAAGSTATTRG